MGERLPRGNGSPANSYLVGARSTTAEPVFHMEGVAVIKGEEGNLQTVEFEWNEPAIAGRPVPRG